MLDSLLSDGLMVSLSMLLSDFPVFLPQPSAHRLTSLFSVIYFLVASIPKTPLIETHLEKPEKATPM